MVDWRSDEPEALGLLALMLHAGARRQARRDERGEFVPLDRQDSGALERSFYRRSREAIACSQPPKPHRALSTRSRGAVGAQRTSPHRPHRLGGDRTALDGLLAHTKSIVVAVNRAVALGELRGSDVGVAALNVLEADNRLADYQPYWAARAALLARAGRRPEAARAYQRAIGLESDADVRNWLQARLANVVEVRI